MRGLGSLFRAQLDALLLFQELGLGSYSEKEQWKNMLAIVVIVANVR